MPFGSPSAHLFPCLAEMESQKKFAPTFSFEFFPPQTPEGMEKLRATRRQLAQLNPKFFSVTFGAGGSTRDRTLETVLEIQAEGYTVAPHLSCIGATGENIRSILKQYRDRGIRHIVALRGDLPSGMAQGGEFRYANELVAFIRAEFGDAFHIEVASYPEYHPQANSAQEDLRTSNRKSRLARIRLSRSIFITPMLTSVSLMPAKRWVSVFPSCPASCRSINFPSWRDFPMPAARKYRAGSGKDWKATADDSASIRAFGLDIVTDLCDRLLSGGAPGIAFLYAELGRIDDTIWQRLGL